MFRKEGRAEAIGGGRKGAILSPLREEDSASEKNEVNAD